MDKTWRCTVCGYLHKGNTPPDICPVCSVDVSKFVLVEDTDTTVSESAASEPAASRLSGFLQEMREAFVPHAVAAHFPNALIPTAVLFFFLFLVIGRESFETAAFYLLVVAVLAIPPTLGSGIYDWKTGYKGNAAPIFRKKIILGCCLLVLGLIVVIWRWQSPGILLEGGLSAWIFLLLVFGMLGCVTLLGHYGGQLVFSKLHSRK